MVPQREVLEHQGPAAPEHAEEAGEDEGNHAGHHRSDRPKVNADKADGANRRHSHAAVGHGPEMSLCGLKAARRDPGPGQGPPPPSPLSSGAGRAASLRLDALPPERAGELLTALLGDDPGQEPHRQLLVRRGKGSVAAYAPSS